MRSIDDIVNAHDYNFVPGHSVKVAIMMSRGAYGIVISVDANQMNCMVMWAMRSGKIEFKKHANYELRHAD